jgi:hypothetical protein
MLERSTPRVRIFPNAPSCLRLIRVLVVETYEKWLKGDTFTSTWSICVNAKKDLLRQRA